MNIRTIYSRINSVSISLEAIFYFGENDRNNLDIGLVEQGFLCNLGIQYVAPDPFSSGCLPGDRG